MGNGITVCDRNNQLRIFQSVRNVELSRDWAEGRCAYCGRGDEASRVEVQEDVGD